MKSYVFIFCMVCITWVKVNACDPDTQYEKDGACCKMCHPGTRMNSQTSCEDPVCIPCGEFEYQSGYTRETKCQLQPVCDENMNFEQKPLDSKVRVSCTCKAEHHCSSEECLTCVHNTACKPGEGVFKMATQFTDTVCQACGQGTFSNETSTVEACRIWTTCDEKTHHIKKEGTPTSDLECVEKSSVGLAVGLSLFTLAILAALVIFLVIKGPEKLKNYFKKNPGDKANKTTDPLIRQEEGLQPPQRAEPENGHGQETESLQVPVENEETLVQVKDGDINVTENNKPVCQEEGKLEHTSIPETDDGSVENSRL